MMKKIYKVILLTILIFLSPTIINGENTKCEYGTYDDAVKIVKESMKSYYMRGPSLQYNYAKTTYPIDSPEEATVQDTIYSVCASYTYSVYTEAFGMKYSEDSKFPRYNYEIIEAATSYYNNNIENNKGDDGTFLIYYEKKDSIKYLYNDSDSSSIDNDLETLIDNINPGDLFVYTGHALIAYDVDINPTTGKKDVLILNSAIFDSVRTRISSTSLISYNFYKNPINNNILNNDKEGTIRWLWLSDLKYFVNNNKLTCQEDECAVIRPFYNDNGKAIFNYSINENQYQKGKLRVQYPGLYIEKTVSAGDNNSVYADDELTYTIKVINKSKEDGSNITYDNFNIEETVGSYVTFISSNGTYNNGKITWSHSLAPGDSIDLIYTVKVSNDSSNNFKEIESHGKFYNSNDINVWISTGTVKNKIIYKSIPEKEYEICYSELKDKYVGLELIDNIYDCSHGASNKLNLLDKFNFDNIFVKKVGTSPKVNSTIIFSDNEFSKEIQDITLNNYWGGLIVDDKGEYYLPNFRGNDNRAKTIYSNDFEDGDILIYYITNSKYTDEDGLYAYIYINDKFIGINGSEKTQRNEFTYTYYDENKYKSSLYSGYENLLEVDKKNVLEFVNYQTLFDKDYFIILRPSILKDVSSSNINDDESKDDININEEQQESNNKDELKNPNTGTSSKTNIFIILLLIFVVVYLLLKNKSRFPKHN